MNRKELKDIVHSQIILPNICNQIIATRHFQRLKKIKQCGGVYYVYPSASQNRYEHSIGTAYLAGVYAKHLQSFLNNYIPTNLVALPMKVENESLVESNHEKLSITDAEVECIQIAGLCHDLGHGPMSHCWDRLMKSSRSGDRIDRRHKYSHEEMSRVIFRDMVENNPEIANALENLAKKIVEIWDIISLIQDMITGVKTEDLVKENDLRGNYYKRKYFLFQIISNQITKIDADKFDYMLRDSKMLDLPVVFDYRKIIYNTGIGEVVMHGQPFNVLIYRREISENLEEIFKDRMMFHLKACQHPKTVLIEQMFIDVILLVQDVFPIHFQCKKTQKPKSLLLKDVMDLCNEDIIEAFLETTDNLLDLIKQYYFWMTSSNMMESNTIFEQALHLINRIENGDHYVSVGHFEVSTRNEITEDFIFGLDQHIENKLKSFPDKSVTLKSRKTLCGYDGTKKNPLDQVKFFYYDDNDLIRRIHMPKYSDPPVEIKHLIYSEEKITKRSLKSVREHLRNKENDNYSYYESRVPFIPE